MKRIMIALAAGALFAALVVPGLASAKRGRPIATASSSSIAINQADPHVGDVVTFSYSTSVTEQCDNNFTLCLRTQVVCTQNGVQVYLGDKEATQQFLLGLGSSNWNAAAPADCAATLYYWEFQPVQQFVPLASTSFTAAP